jgi:hypothetical protein
MKVTIYAILFIDTPIYIGQSLYPKRRLSFHKKHFNRKTITLLKLHECDPFDKFFWERHYISLFQSWGFDLANKDDEAYRQKSRLDFIIKNFSANVHRIR